MATIKLTKRAIDAFTYEGVEFKDEAKGRDVRWDATLPGFGVRIYPTGRKAFLLSYRVRGRKRMMAIGNFGTLTLGQARDRARKLLVQARDGRDPLEERRKTAQGKTFGDLITAYIERHAKVHKRTWPEDQRRLRTHPPAAWKARSAGSITRKEIADLHGRIGTTKPYEANRFLETLQKMFALAGIWGFVDEMAPNPARGIQRFRERKRKRWLKPEELPRLAQAIDNEPNIYMRAAFWLYLLSGLRKSELLQARWEDIDWSRGTLCLPDTKSGDEQHATLNAPALAILQSIPRMSGNPFVLPGAKRGHHLIKIDKAWSRIRTAARVKDLRLHDLRRTVGSWLSQSGVELNLIKEALRHAAISTTLTYARLGQDAARDVMENHGRRVLEAAGRSRPVEVVKGGAKD